MQSDSLESLVQQELVSKRGVLLGRCVDLLGETSGLSDLAGLQEWQHFLEQSRNQLVSELQTPEPEPLSVLGASGKGTESSRLGTLREHGASFADALSVWPDICAAAEDFCT